jgi:hypothetical protein
MGSHRRADYLSARDTGAAWLGADWLHDALYVGKGGYRFALDKVK